MPDLTNVSSRAVFLTWALLFCPIAAYISVIAIGGSFAGDLLVVVAMPALLTLLAGLALRRSAAEIAMMAAVSAGVSSVAVVAFFWLLFSSGNGPS